jgi:hypothetical protein
MVVITTGYACHIRHDKVFDCFDAIAATTKRTEKHNLLAGMQKSGAMHTMLFLVFSKDKFYVTAKTINYNGQASATKKRYASTDEAVHDFLDVVWKQANNKLSGNAGKQAINEVFAAIKKSKDNVHPSTHKWLLAVLDKNLRIGIDTSVAELFPDIIEVFGIPKGIALIEQKTGKRVPRAVKMISYPCDLEPKKDGFNVSIVCDTVKKTAKAMSSDNEELPALRPYARVVLKSLLKQKLPKQFGNATKIVVDGEVEARFDITNAIDTKSWKSSWGKTSALCKAGILKTGFDASAIKPLIQDMIHSDLDFTLYEIYPVSAHTSVFECPRLVRRKLFEAIADQIRAIKYTNTSGTECLRKRPIKAIAYKTCRNEKELEAQHARNVGDGEEGSIIRMPDVGVLADSKWRGNFVKYKEYNKIDAVILGVVEGTGKNAGSAGAFQCYVPATKAFTKVTVPTDKVKAWVWKNRALVHGFNIEIIGAKDKTSEANASRNPVLARFRHDQLPLPLAQVKKLCEKARIAIPVKDNMGVKLFSQALARLAV